MSRLRLAAMLHLVFLASVLLAPARLGWAQAIGTAPQEGIRQNTPRVVALTNARLVTEPGRLVESGVLVVRDGMITQVGSNVQPPADARIVDLDGKTVYPGLIDAFGEVDQKLAAGGSPYWNSLISPQLNVADVYRPDSALDAMLRTQGVTARLVAPASGIFKGVSTFVLTAGDAREAIVSRHVAQHLRLTVPRGRGRDNYPNSPMGAVALARQTLFDAAWYGQARVVARAGTALPSPEQNDALDVLATHATDSPLFIADAPNELYFLRADRFAREFGLRLVVRGSGNEYRRLDAIRASGRSVIVPLDFPTAPNVATAEAARNVTLERLLHWDLAPENAERLDAAGIPIALTSNGLDDPGKLLEAVRRAVRRGLSPESALRALTITPAELYGVSNRVGTLEAGKLANLVVTDGDLFAKGTKVVETWVRGRQFEIATPARFDARGRWQVTLTEPNRRDRKFVVELTGTPSRLKGELRSAGASDDDADAGIDLKRLQMEGRRLTGTFASNSLGHDGLAQFTAVVFTPDAAEATWTGYVVWPSQQRSAMTAVRSKSGDVDDNKGEAAAADDDQPRAEAASFAVNFPLGAFGRESAPAQPSAVLFTNATVWTCNASGERLDNASVLVGDGKVLAVGVGIEAPADAVIVDCRGKHLTPGIIDCHSHMATDGGINESTQAITAEVRIGDFIDCDDIAIYRQLAGGVTTANVLHGSANPIGGQNQVIKLRWGALPEEMKFAEAPPGIKFALGENVKQSNWGSEYTSRYPQSRMGVEQIMRDAFTAGREYRHGWERWNRTHQGLPPRHDLELEALAEIVAGQRWVHCHSYRQDEILALIRTLDDFGIQIGSFQHILEGYKVADAMARHGATGSAFSDWWAYKFEVYDAIPYAGALMHNAGVVVSFNSDDRELARHLNQEAAKAVKYGGVPPAEALKFVTLNPARQLRIDTLVGSLEPGKHADLVVWSGPPLSNFSRCEQTWIDGRKYFDIDEDGESRRRAADVRAALVQKILDSGEKQQSPGEDDVAEEDLWPREDLFCHHHAPHDEHDEHDEQH